MLSNLKGHWRGLSSRNHGFDYPLSLSYVHCSSIISVLICFIKIYSACLGKGKEVCEDKKTECTMWEASGSCESNRKYMEKFCRMSCGFCEGMDIIAITLEDTVLNLH